MRGSVTSTTVTSHPTNRSTNAAVVAAAIGLGIIEYEPHPRLRTTGSIGR